MAVAPALVLLSPSLPPQAARDAASTTTPSVAVRRRHMPQHAGACGAGKTEVLINMGNPRKTKPRVGTAFDSGVTGGGTRRPASCRRQRPESLFKIFRATARALRTDTVSHHGLGYRAGMALRAALPSTESLKEPLHENSFWTLAGTSVAAGILAAALRPTQVLARQTPQQASPGWRPRNATLRQRSRLWAKTAPPA